MKISGFLGSFETPTLIQLGQRVMTGVAVAAVVVMTVWLWFSWEQTRQAELARIARVAKIVAAHADNYFLSHELKIQALARELQSARVLTAPGKAMPLLQVYQQESPDVAVVSILDLSGRRIASTATNPKTKRAERVALPPRGHRPIRILSPQYDSDASAWTIPVQQMVHDRSGVSQFAIEARILLDAQQAPWRDLQGDTHSIFGLQRRDGARISRLPDGSDRARLYANPPSSPMFDATRGGALQGFFEGPDFFGRNNLGAFRKLNRYPVYAYVAELHSNIVGLWWGVVRWPLILILFSILLAALVYVRLARTYGGRMRVVQDRMASASSFNTSELPYSGVREIDTLVGELNLSHTKLREAERNRERQLLQAAGAGTYSVRERDRVVLTADSVFADLLGLQAPEIVGHLWSHCVDDTGFAGNETAGNDALTQRIVTVHSPVDGHPRWLSVAEYREPLPDGEIVRFGLALDVSSRERLLNRVNLQSQRLQALWHLAMSRGRSDDEKMRLMLELARDSLHLDVVLACELLDGQLVIRVSADKVGHFSVGRSYAQDNLLCKEMVAHREIYEIADLRADSDFYRHSISVSSGIRGFVSSPIYVGSMLYGSMLFMRQTPLGDDFGSDERAFMALLAAWFGQLVSEERHRVELERLAMTDALTLLPNRRTAELRFHEEVARARRSHEIFSIGVCDLDRFKVINDQYGHDVGDQVLVHIAGILRLHLREGDWAARWGGEEFIVFLHRATTEEAIVAMERLRMAVQGNPVSTDYGPLHVTTSIGIGTFRENMEISDVLSEADGCLYEAKHAGRDKVVATETNRRGTLWKAGMLQHALLENRIIPAYQPIVDLKSRDPVAEEALARIVEPDGRLVPANDFIEAAEGINLIHVVDEVILRQAVQRAAAEKPNPDRPFAHFVNLSAQFLSRREQVQSLLQLAVENRMASGGPRSLVLEVTERQLIGNFDSLVHDLEPLVEAGFRLALDDFGSGYSSFLYLARLPISFLKIEGWMVQNIHSNPKVLAMVESMIRLARDQGIITIAEHVEDAAAADLLAELGADWAQGYFFGRPRCDMAVVRNLTRARTGT